MFKQEAAEAAAAANPAPLPEGGEPTSAGAKEIAAGAGVQEISPADAAQLRKQEPKRYAQLVRDKKLVITNQQ